MKCGKNRGRRKEEFKIQRVANLANPIEQELAYSFLRFVDVIDIDRFIKELKLDKYSKGNAELLRYAFNYYKNINNREKLLKELFYAKNEDGFITIVAIPRDIAMGILLFENALLTALTNKNSKEYECINKTYFEPFNVRIEPFTPEPDNTPKSMYERKIELHQRKLDAALDEYDRKLLELSKFKNNREEK